MTLIRSSVVAMWLGIVSVVAAAGTAGVCGVGSTGDAALGLPAMPGGEADTAGRQELGRRLFNDRRLSADGRMACATCHVPAEGFTQTERATPAGRDGQALRRNAPSLFNVGFAAPLMHDGAAPSLEVQVLTPLLDRNEMANQSPEDLERRLAGIDDYAQAFQSEFGGPPTLRRVGEALAAYQRTLMAGHSRFDRWKFGGEAGALAEDERRGFALFAGRAGCVRCHAVGEGTALFSDNAMHNTGAAFAAESGRLARPAAPAAGEAKDLAVNFALGGDRGRHEVTGTPGDLYRYRTPTLRNVALTAPYMHDGSIATLEGVVRFYNAGGGSNANLDPAIKPLGLDDSEIAALVAFLKSLTGSTVDDLAARAGQLRP